jgi:hypothetical protein
LLRVRVRGAVNLAELSVQLLVGDDAPIATAGFGGVLARSAAPIRAVNSVACSGQIATPIEQVN